MEKKRRNKNKINVLSLSKLDYDDNSQDVNLISGTPIIARKNCKELDIFNNETFMVEEIRHKHKIIVIVDDDGLTYDIKFEEFQKLFYVAFCITTHKSQGCTFDHPYTIHEFKKFDDRLKYVSLSRATDMKYINII